MIRSTYSFVVDALSGERLDIMLQCVKLRLDDASLEESDAFDAVLRATFTEEYTRPLIVVGDRAPRISSYLIASRRISSYLIVSHRGRRPGASCPYA